ncbi:hypothetical protein N0V95_007835 [Ascochyta clinopodiicola]|nr:hypothetical protein N0V95_007835 [Ascochyta clinopodiicola]
MSFAVNNISQSSKLVEQWIADPTLHQLTRDRPDFLIDVWPLEKRWVNLALLSPAVFSRRLQIAMNTFWDASVGSDIRTGNFTIDQVTRMTKNTTKKWNTTELAGVKYDGEQYVCNIAFATITIAISFALFLAAVISLILGIVIKAPDILGFVSTSARDNPYVDQQVNSRSDGLEAARALRDVRIRIGDVSEDMAASSLKIGSRSKV